MKPILLMCVMSLLVACGGGNGGSSNGATISERSGDNNSNATAQLIEPNNVISGDLNIDTDDIDIYKFTVSEQQMFEFSLTGPSGTDFDIYLSDDTDGYIAGSDDYNSTEEIKIILTPGTYRIEVETYDGNGAYLLSIMAGTASVFLDEGSVCLEFNGLNQEVATELASSIYSRGECSGTYRYQCDIDVEGIPGAINFTSTVNYSDATDLCDDYSGTFTIL